MLKLELQNLHNQLNLDFIKENQLTLFQTAEGREYKNCKFKLMLVGRCINGGNSEEINLQPNFGWVKNWFTKHHGLTRSPFFKTTGNIFKQLADFYGQKYTDSEWYENIVWTNLYRISPQLGGLPPDRYLKLQRNLCQQCLLDDIQKYNPDYIPFVTDWEYWITDFFDEIYLKGFKLLEDNKVIKAEGIFLNSKALVVKRPDNPRRSFSHTEYEKIIFNTFKNTWG